MGYPARRELAADCVAHGIEDLHAGTLQRAVPYRIKQLASRAVFVMYSIGLSTGRGSNRTFKNCALFEPFHLRPKCSSAIRLSDPDVAQALAIHHLDIDVAGRREPAIALRKFDSASGRMRGQECAMPARGSASSSSRGTGPAQRPSTRKHFR